MACLPSENVAERLIRAARSGDWDSVESLTATLNEQPEPRDRDALCQHLRNLREVLIVAKACRAGLHASASRLNAAALFQRLSESQNSGTVTGS